MGSACRHKSKHYESKQQDEFGWGAWRLKMCLKPKNFARTVPPKGSCRELLQLCVSHLLKVLNESEEPRLFLSAKKYANSVGCCHHSHILQTNIYIITLWSSITCQASNEAIAPQVALEFCNLILTQQASQGNIWKKLSENKSWFAVAGRSECSGSKWGQKENKTMRFKALFRH